MEKSFVGDPVQWPGLVYSPLNGAGLIFALGAIAGSAGLLFEELNEDCQNAICRRKTEAGWERLKVAFAVRSSTFFDINGDVDLLICWTDDASEAIHVPCLVLAPLASQAQKASIEAALPAKGLESILPDGAARDLLERGQSHESYQETVRLLDEQIKKLQSN